MKAGPDQPDQRCAKMVAWGGEQKVCIRSGGPEIDVFPVTCDELRVVNY